MLQLSAIPGALRRVTDGRLFNVLVRQTCFAISCVFSCLSLAPGDTAAVRCLLCCCQAFFHMPLNTKKDQVRRPSRAFSLATSAIAWVASRRQGSTEFCKQRFSSACPWPGCTTTSLQRRRTTYRREHNPTRVFFLEARVLWHRAGTDRKNPRTKVARMFFFRPRRECASTRVLFLEALVLWHRVRALRFAHALLLSSKPRESVCADFTRAV